MVSLRRRATPVGRPAWRDVPLYVWLLLGGFVAIMFSGQTKYLHLPISLDRVLFPAAFVLLVLDARRERLRWRPVYWFMIALLVWTLISMSATGGMSNTLALYGLLDRIAVPFLLFALAPLAFSTPYRRDLLLRTLVIIGGYLGVTSVCEIFAPSLVFPRYIMDPDVGMQFGRARGPFVASEANGLVNATCVFAAAALAARSRGLWRTLALVVAPLCVIATVLSMTRSAWIGLPLGACLAAVVYTPVRRWLPLALGGAAAMITAVLLAAPAVTELIVGRLTTEGSIYDRFNTNEAAWRILNEQPLTGIGWARFLSDGADWVRQDDNYPLTNVIIEVHNVFLSRAAELGIPAAFVFVCCLLYGPARALLDRQHGDLAMWRAIGVGTAGLWIVAAMSSPLSYPLPNYLFWAITGIAGRSYLVSRAVADEEDPPVESLPEPRSGPRDERSAQPLSH